MNRPDLIIGASSHSRQEALAAQKAGASYVNIGPLFPTKTKQWSRNYLGIRRMQKIAAKIKVNYEKCIACLACEKACPSDVMSAILRQDRVIPDCFSCGVCTEICPEKAISFSKEKREKPSVAKFNKQ